MFLELTARRNPWLLEHAAWLHQQQRIPPNTYVLDADSIVHNAELIARAGHANHVTLNVMTKQFGRNPRVAQLIKQAGLDRFVAVDVDEARILWRAGLHVAHVGHLVGCAAYDLREVLQHRPLAITVFDIAQADRINRVAGELGLRQNLLLRLYEPDLSYHPCQHGGFTLGDLDATLEAMAGRANVAVTGVTTHPALEVSYDTGAGWRTPKVDLLLAGADKVRAATGAAVEINSPGVTCVATIPLLAGEGLTTGEPGSALTGTTPLHAHSEQPELPAVVYVSEVSHTFHERVFTFGGGFYPRGRAQGALLGRDGKLPIMRLKVVDAPPEAIDYYGELGNETDQDVRTGDTALYAFRNQIFVTRARVAVVEGLRSSTPRVSGIYDSTGTLLAES